jgi:hypothetical protein
MIRISLDMEGLDLGLVLLVPHRSGVAYRQQCNGAKCEHRELEGFALPMAGAAAARGFMRWFEERFPSYSLPENWREEDYADLSSLVRTIMSWPEDSADNAGDLVPLELDRERLGEVTEAWIPVVSALGPAVLVFENSD